MSRWLSLLAFATGLGVLVVTGIFGSLKLQSVEALNGAYGDQPMLAFELAESPADLARVIGPNPPTAKGIAVRAALDHANYIDFIYMALYAGFIACSCAHLGLAQKRRWLLVAAMLGPIAACFDVAENLALLSLTRSDANVSPLACSLTCPHFCEMGVACTDERRVRRRLCWKSTALDYRCRILSKPHRSCLRHPHVRDPPMYSALLAGRVPA